ncbi:MAG: hydroxyacylglutathione hydrolase [Alphaproteobacteria bacterium]|jgi:hydroxyacylglutathione hydrolase|nr:hydroxyacylglutathione hydrolase [Alphaproteobacteria bacterium]MDP7222997.1 hydroxyacylglutathione hydrolase [Alphaproteobacteria bacterium]
MTATVEIIPILEDNYCYILQDSATQKTAVIDPGEAEPVIAYLEGRDITPDFILNTHYHWDHTDGNAAIKKQFGCKIIGPTYEAAKIPGIDQTLRDGDIFQCGDIDISVKLTPGHTRGHICFYLPQDHILFSGDTLFSMGTGRLFEGSAEQMFEGLCWIKSLPPETMIYAGHEYTLDNAAFCLSIEPDNAALIKRGEQAHALRAQDKPTLPVSLATELETNAMLRASTAAQYADLRTKKDHF